MENHQRRGGFPSWLFRTAIFAAFAGPFADILHCQIIDAECSKGPGKVTIRAKTSPGRAAFFTRECKPHTCRNGMTLTADESGWVTFPATNAGNALAASHARVGDGGSWSQWVPCTATPAGCTQGDCNGSGPGMLGSEIPCSNKSMEVAFVEAQSPCLILIGAKQSLCGLSPSPCERVLKKPHIEVCRLLATFGDHTAKRYCSEAVRTSLELCVLSRFVRGQDTLRCDPGEPWEILATYRKWPGRIEN